MTDTYLVLTTPTTTDVFPVRDIDRIWSDGVSLRVTLRPWGNNGANATAQLATTIPTEDPARALLLATQALSGAILTGKSAQAEVGCAQFLGTTEREPEMPGVGPDGSISAALMGSSSTLELASELIARTRRDLRFIGAGADRAANRADQAADRANRGADRADRANRADR